MMVLMIFGGAIFGFAYMNHQSAEQQYGIFRARVAATSLLYEVGSIISDDFTSLSPRIPLTKNIPITAVLEDGLISAEVNILTKDERLFVLEGSATYRDWQSGKRGLEIFKKVSVLSSDPTVTITRSEWIWR